jgi:hypothetical protein
MPIEFVTTSGSAWSADADLDFSVGEDKTAAVLKTISTSVQHQAFFCIMTFSTRTSAPVQARYDYDYVVCRKSAGMIRFDLSLAAHRKVIYFLPRARIDHSDLREAISIEKRYFTSDLSNLSYASFTF